MRTHDNPNPTLSVASNASGLTKPSEPWILIRWYQHLDPFKDCRTRLVVRVEVLIVDEFLLQGRPAAFHHSVVVLVAGTAHHLRHAMLLERFAAYMTWTTLRMPGDVAV